MEKTKRKEQIIDIIKNKGMLRPRELREYNIPRISLKRLVDQGILKCSGRGLYFLADAEITEYHTFAQAAKRIPRGVVCLISALKFHELTTQIPFEVWMAIEKNARKPVIDQPKIHFVRFSKKAFSDGIEEHTIEGVKVKIYGPAKTVADCFKFRNKIGLDIALEALRSCLKQKKCLYDDLWHYAKICRVENIMKPYLEAIV